MARLSFWYFQILFSPVDGEHDEHQGGENIAAGPHHHQPLARKVPRVPLQAEFSKIFLYVYFDTLPALVSNN